MDLAVCVQCMWGRVFCAKTEDLGTRRCGPRRLLESHSLKGPSPKSLAGRAPGPQTARAQVQRPQGHRPKAHWAQGPIRSAKPSQQLGLARPSQRARPLDRGRRPRPQATESRPWKPNGLKPTGPRPQGSGPVAEPGAKPIQPAQPRRPTQPGQPRGQGISQMPKDKFRQRYSKLKDF